MTPRNRPSTRPCSERKFLLRNAIVVSLLVAVAGRPAAGRRLSLHLLEVWIGFLRRCAGVARTGRQDRRGARFAVAATPRDRGRYRLETGMLRHALSPR